MHRNYDPALGEYLEPDPLGLGGGVAMYAYAEGEPLLYIDPWGLAKIRYFAIDEGSRINAEKMPDKSHWAFAVYGISDHADKVLVFDKGGSYISGKSFQLFKNTTPPTQIKGLADHYAAKGGYFSPGEFEIEISDSTAKGIITNITNITGEDLGLMSCPALNSMLLPTVNLGNQGILDPQAGSKGEANRIVRCKPNAKPEEIRFERIKKSIEVHESDDNDCARASSQYGGKKACPAGTWNPSIVPGTSDRAPASFGWVQFIFRTIAGELRVNFNTYKSTLEELGITKAQLDAAEICSSRAS